MNTTMKKAMNIALKVVTGLLIAFTVFMMLFTVITVTTVDKNDRAIFGTRFYIVQTDSMSLSENNKDMDVHFNAGDIILIKDVADKTALEPGDIIAFISMNNESLGETITHMIREVEYKNGKVVGYVTFGTNTGANDAELVEPAYVIGKYSGKLPGVGNFFAFVKSVPGYIVCILIPFLLLILYNGVDVIRLFRKYKKEQMDAMQAEKDQIEADRAETQRMLEELLALKAQLEQKNSAPAPVATPEATAEAAVEKAEESKEESNPEETAAPEKEEAPSEPEQETCEAEATEEPAIEAEADLDEAVEEPIEEPKEPVEAENSEEEVANEPLSEEAPEEESAEEPSEAAEESESPAEETSDEN